MAFWTWIYVRNHLAHVQQGVQVKHAMRSVESLNAAFVAVLRGNAGTGSACVVRRNGLANLGSNA